MSNFLEEIENEYSRLRGMPSRLSPMDWNLAQVWEDSGLPLRVVLRAMGEVAEKFRAQKRTDKINSLSYFKHFRASSLGHYPHHWVMHLTHALEIVAYRSPYSIVQSQARKTYYKIISSMHVNAETVEQMEIRLSEDRIAKGCIVE